MPDFYLFIIVKSDMRELAVDQRFDRLLVRRFNAGVLTDLFENGAQRNVTPGGAHSPRIGIGEFHERPGRAGFLVAQPPGAKAWAER